MNKVVYFCVILIFCFTSGSPIISKDNQSGNTADVINFRLPNNTRPLEYKISIETKVHENNFKFNGVVEIRIVSKLTEDDAKIVLHARQLKILQADLFNSNGMKFTNIEAKYDITTEFLTIYSSKHDLALQLGKEYTLKISYEGNLREDNGGFYRSSYLNSRNEKIYLATTQFESTDARHGFPCYDEPGLKAKFTISITHGKNFNAISNMPELKKIPKPSSDMVTTEFKKTPLMSTYLVAFVVSNFENTSTKNHKVYSRPGSEAEQEFALTTSIKTLNEFERYLGVKYSLPKMFQVAVPDFAAGAMENWGLVTYREEYLLYNPNRSTVNTETNIASIIAHEYAHQWFGNLVSPVWWTYTWLNEGFASLFSYIGTDLVYPKWGYLEHFIVAEYQRALGADVGRTSRPMTHYVQEPKDIVGLFDSISYSKAACVLRMMQHVISEKTFKRGLQLYLQKMEYSNAEEDDLFQNLQIAIQEHKVELPASISTIMKSWSNQGGFPLLTVTRNYNNGTFTIEQQSYHNDLNENDDKLWWIPYNFVTANNPLFNDTTFDGFLKKEKSIVIESGLNKTWTNADWVILNKQQTGYFRVNYDTENWNLIIKALQTDPKVVHTYNRAQLIDDATKLTLSNRFNVKSLFSLLSYLSKEESYAPWVSANNALFIFNKYLKEDKDSSFLQFFIQTIISDIYKKLGTKDKENEPHFSKYTRKLAIKWACEATMTDCLDNTYNRLKDFVQHGKTIEPNMQESIYCYGLKKATDADFEFLFKHLMQSIDAAERQMLISSLGCAVKPSQIRLLLTSSISREANITLRPQERIIILKSAYTKTSIGFTTAINFLMESYKEYFDLTPGFLKVNPLNDDLIQMSNIVANEEQKQKIEELIEKVKEHPKFDKKVPDIVANNIKSNLNWIKKYRAEVVEWLKDYQKTLKGAGNNVIVTPFLFVVSIMIIASVNSVF